MFCSMIIPIYNPNEQRFKQLLTSIQNQTDKDFKVYFVNDCGNDDFKNNIKDILIDIDYEILDLDHNVGQGLARQAALDICTDDWVTFVDQDDSLAETMIFNAKKIIKETQCFYVLATKSVVANDNNWVINKQYTVENSPSVLHGKFYNKQQIDKYGIHFSDKVRAHEDTFFQNLIYSYLALDKDLKENSNSYIESDIITYFWYLWNDSTSHSKEFNKKTLSKVSYLEDHMHEYVTATIESYKEVIKRVPADEMFFYSKFCSFLYFLYWFEQSFEYFNPLCWKKENLIYVKEARDFVIKEMGMGSVKELTNLLIDIPDLYYFTFNEIFTNVDGYFVPRLTIEQFYQGLEDRIRLI